MRRLALKNSGESVIVDLRVFTALAQDPYLVAIGFLHNLRRHSSGCAVFQRTYKASNSKSGYRTETIYLHKFIAERYLLAQKAGNKKLVGCKNGNKLDCRLANLEYRTRSIASRKRKSSSKAGYTGVYQEGNRFRAVISKNKKSLHLGMFTTPEEAAIAYNKKSQELFGLEGKINVIRPHASSGESVQGEMASHKPAREDISLAFPSTPLTVEQRHDQE